MNNISMNSADGSKLAMRSSFLQSIQNHRRINEILHKQKDNSNKTSSNEELFAEIEKSRITQQNQTNSSGESKEPVRSKTVDKCNRLLDRAINMFNPPIVLLLPQPPEDVEGDQMIQEIHQVFSKKVVTKESTLPPTSSSLQGTPDHKGLINQHRYGSILSTEISNEPDYQKTPSRVSLQTSGSDNYLKYQHQQQQQQMPYQQLQQQQQRIEQYQRQEATQIPQQRYEKQQDQQFYRQEIYQKNNDQFQQECYQKQDVNSRQEYYQPQYYQPYDEEASFYENNQRRKRKTISEEDSYQYIIRVEKVEMDKRTTVMIKNIPNKYTLQLLIDLIDQNYKNNYDFLYLPIDFKNRCNMGYAFINFVEPKYIQQFHNEFQGQRWPHFNSEKICQLRYARIQGRNALISHFQYSSVMNQKDKKLKPVIVPQNELSRIQQLIRNQRQSK